MNLEDLKLVTFQTTLFTPAYSLATAAVFQKLFPKWVRLFDGQPMTFPDAEGMPADVPRAIFLDSQGEWKAEIAASRINLYWQHSAKSGRLLPMAECAKELVPLLIEYHDFCEGAVGRMAMVISWVLETDDPPSFLVERYSAPEMRTGASAGAAGFELHVLHRATLEGDFSVNSWIRNRTGKWSRDGATVPVVIVQQDVNTLAEEVDSKRFSREDVVAYFQRATEEAQNRLNQHFG